MNLVAISRGSLSAARKLADILSQSLNIPVITREQVLEEAQKFGISESGLTEISWTDRSPNILEKQSFRSKHYILSFKATLLEFALQGSMIYLGHLGHLFLRDVPFLLKIRINRPEESRIQYLMNERGISYETARNELLMIDDRRRKWADFLYGVDIMDPSQYDIIFNAEKFNFDMITDIVKGVLNNPVFNSTEETLQILQNEYLKSLAEIYLYLSPATRGYEVRIKADANNKSLFIKALDSEIDREKFETYLKISLANIEEIQLINFEY